MSIINVHMLLSLRLKVFLFSIFRQSSVQVRIGFLKFADPNDVAVAMHLSNTVFIDRALIVAPYSGSNIREREKTKSLCFPQYLLEILFFLL